MTNILYDALFGRNAGREAAFLHLPDGSGLSYAAFLARAAQFAGELSALGLHPGDRLAAQIGKSADALALYAACVQAGVVFLPLNPAYTPTELGYFVSDADAALLICDPRDEAALAGLGAPLLRSFGTDGTGSFIAAALARPKALATVARGPDDLAALLYTSGTTGRSKGAMLSHKNLLSNAEALVEAWRFTEADVLLHALPIFHTHGLFVASNVTLLAGGAMVFLPRFDSDTVLRHLPDATAMMGVPTFYTRLLDDPRLSREACAHMRLFISGSAPLLAETHRDFALRSGHQVLERYGMTETNMNTSNPYQGARRAGTVGQPLPGVALKITDPETGAELPKGEIGQIEVRGPNVFQGYWRMPEKTKAELRADGFFITGDLGLIDDQGYVQIVGRGKDLIISGGYNIYPKEVELLLDEQPGVRESAVVGAPHPDLGEAPVAVLVARPGEVPDIDAIGEALGQVLARYKIPREMVLMAELPRNTMGKVQKNALREVVAGVFAPAAPKG